MTKKELIEMVASDYEKQGYQYTAAYRRMFGLEEPLLMPCIFKEHFEAREEIAEKCVKAGKTATELGLYKPLKPGIKI